MLSCAGADRLQTGMRHAYGKSYGLCARVGIRQIMLSVRSKDTGKKHVLEALRRAKYKFPGRQKIIISNNWGFTKIPRADYLAIQAAGGVKDEGAHSRLLPNKGPLKDYNP
eukprot:TRINITY_DN883_c0_g1_i2.p1 TRINITY_DN883_c0_g1~~TRINITY_DN883_c0_g1_i2.p1  ORF type:complete len:111 (-),score=13.93 TRINITY_DN883_c0_g1_i2:87-419(-)